MQNPDLHTNHLRVLLSWESAPYQVPPTKFSENQVNLCTEFGSGFQTVDLPPILGQTPSQPYDIYDFVVNQMGMAPDFDLVVVSISGIKRNLPYNFREFGCPSVAIVTDTHHGYSSPIGELLTYLNIEQYDYICFPYCRQHMHWFYAARLDNLGWLPLVTMTNFYHNFSPERSRETTFICGNPIKFHPYRTTVVQALLSSSLKLRVGSLDRVSSSQVYAKSLISLNCSLNGDVNLRNLEIVSAGGFLLTDRTSPQSGFDKLLIPGRECDTYASITELFDKITYYLDNPEQATSIAKNAYSKFYELLHPNYRINELYQWIFNNQQTGQFLNDYDSRFAVSREYAELLETRVKIYEQIQELHRLQESVSILVEDDCEIIFAIDLVDLCRARVYVHSDSEEKISTAERSRVSQQIHFINDTAGEWDVYIFKSKTPDVRAKFSILLDDRGQLVFSSLQKFSSFSKLPIKTSDNQNLLVSYFNDSGAQYVINEIFNVKCYPILPFIDDVNVIVDVGANVGFASAYFRLSYPDAKIYGFEPDPVAFLLLRDNYRSFGNSTAHPFGLYSDDVSKTFYLGDSSVHSSIHSNVLTATPLTIDLKRADSFLIENGIANIDILKADTEGCEVEILRRVMIHDFGIKVIYLEFHSEEDRRLLDQILSPQYLLWNASVNYGHRGNLCYVRRDWVPQVSGIESLQK